MTIGRPCVEREHGTEHTKSDKDEGEEHLLNFNGNVVQGCNLKHIHGGGTREEIDAQDSQNEQCRTTHEHERELHGRIFLGTTSPHADEQIHGDEGNLIEHEHGEQVYRDKEPVNTR